MDYNARTPIKRGTFLPISEYGDGTAGFDSDSGLLGMAKRAITAPARAWWGEITDDQMLDEGTNFAGLLALGGGSAAAAAPAKNSLMSMYKAFGPQDAAADALRTARISGADRFLIDDAATSFALQRHAPAIGEDLLDMLRARGMGPANNNRSK